MPNRSSGPAAPAPSPRTTAPGTLPRRSSPAATTSARAVSEHPVVPAEDVLGGRAGPRRQRRGQPSPACRHGALTAAAQPQERAAERVRRRYERLELVLRVQPPFRELPGRVGRVDIPRVDRIVEEEVRTVRAPPVVLQEHGDQARLRMQVGERRPDPTRKVAPVPLDGTHATGPWPREPVLASGGTRRSSSPHPSRVPVLGLLLPPSRPNLRPSVPANVTDAGKGKAAPARVGKHPRTLPGHTRLVAARLGAPAGLGHHRWMVSPTPTLRSGPHDRKPYLCAAGKRPGPA